MHLLEILLEFIITWGSHWSVNSFVCASNHHSSNHNTSNLHSKYTSCLMQKKSITSSLLLLLHKKKKERSGHLISINWFANNFRAFCRPLSNSSLMALHHCLLRNEFLIKRFPCWLHQSLSVCIDFEWSLRIVDNPPPSFGAHFCVCLSVSLSCSIVYFSMHHFLPLLLWFSKSSPRGHRLTPSVEMLAKKEVEADPPIDRRPRTGEHSKWRGPSVSVESFFFAVEEMYVFSLSRQLSALHASCVGWQYNEDDCAVIETRRARTNDHDLQITEAAIFLRQFQFRTEDESLHLKWSNHKHPLARNFIICRARDDATFWHWNLAVIFINFYFPHATPLTLLWSHTVRY